MQTGVTPVDIMPLSDTALAGSMDAIFAIGDVLVEDAKRRLGDQIALIVYTGSRIKGTGSAYSDLDLYYVPRTGIGAHCTLLYGQTPFDLFPISWHGLEGRANYDHPHTSVLVDAKVVYAGSAAELTRFTALQDRIFALQLPENRRLMVEKAIGIFQGVGYGYFLFDAACAPTDLFAWKREAWKMVETTLYALAVMNQTFYHSDCGKNLAEVLALPQQPPALCETLAVIVESTNYATVKSALCALLHQTKALLTRELQAQQPLVPFAEQFRAYYPELREQINKIVAACELQHAQRALAAVVQIQNEVADLLSRTVDGQSAAGLHAYSDYSMAYQQLALPDLIGYIGQRDFVGLRQAAEALDHKMRVLLTHHNVALNIISTPAELADLAAIWNRL